MARKCVYCEKKPVVGNKVSHSNIKTKIRKFPNLQKIRAFIGGTVQNVYACTRCLRSGKALKPPVRKYSPAAAPEAAQA